MNDKEQKLAEILLTKTANASDAAAALAYASAYKELMTAASVRKEVERRYNFPKMD